MAKTKGPVFRVRGLQASQPDDELTALLKATIDDNLTEEIHSKPTASIEIVSSCYSYDEKVALVEFHGGAPAFLSKLTDNPLADWEVEMGDTHINFDQHFFGFTQLYTPKADSFVTADIIAITGLNGHAYGSWRGKGNSGRIWLRDFLCKDLPCCRTMIYGYDSKLSSYGIDTIMDYGRGLMEELKKVRNTEELQKRPLFFVAHSFGGIILAHCLVKAAQTDEGDDPSIVSLCKATYGMLLFGIPHKGLMVDDIEKMLAGKGNHPRSALLQQIRSKSDMLAFQLVDFKNLIRDRKVVSFYETGQTRRLEFDSESKRWKRTGDFFTAVDTDSALLQLPDSIEDKIPLETDHSTMVKFDIRNQRGYSSARDKLLRFQQDAPKVVAGRFRTLPKPGSLYIIQSAVMGKVITYQEGQLVLGPLDGRHVIHWRCVKNKGRFGFQDSLSGLFMGYDTNEELCCVARTQSLWENFTIEQELGGYRLLMTHYDAWYTVLWDELRPIGIKDRHDSKVIAMVEDSRSDGTIWQFIVV